MNLAKTEQKQKQTERLCVVGVMAKFWQPGRVKTRLGSTIGMERSAKLHQIFVGHLLTQMSRGSGTGTNKSGQGRAGNNSSAAKNPWTTQWVSSPPDCLEASRKELSAWGLDQNEHKVEVVDQGQGDLGDRMLRWFDQRLSQERAESKPNFGRAILIGADCPLLDPSDITEAFEALCHTDAVLGPAADGGYYLIGFRSVLNPKIKRVFSEIRWSEADVFDITCQRIKEIGMTVSLLPMKEDVDTETELNRLRKMLAKESAAGAESVKQLSDSVDYVMKSDHEA